MKNVTIGNKELGLRATPLALLYYQQEFKKDLLEDLMSFQSLANIKNGDYSGLDTIKILQLLYVMNKADNFGKKDTPDFTTWLSKLESVDFADEKWLLDVMEEAEAGFFRSAGIMSSAKQETK